MKTLRSLLLVWLALFVLSACQESDLFLADGSEGRFDEYRGQWLLINYWAEWCGPCRKEIPELNELHHQGDGIVVLGVNYDGLVGEKLTDLITTMGIEFPVLLNDPRARWQQETPAVLPTTYVIDPAGELAEVLVGPQSLDSLKAAVERHAQL